MSKKIIKFTKTYIKILDEEGEKVLIKRLEELFLMNDIYNENRKMTQFFTQRIMENGFYDSIQENVEIETKNI